MKLLVAGTALAGILGLVMMSGMPLTPAYANIFLIDNFTGDGGPEAGDCDFSLTMGESTRPQSGLSEVIDMIRECTLKIQLIPQGMGPESMVTVDQSFPVGRFLQEGGDGVLDLSESDNLRIDYALSDFLVLVNATLIDSAGESATLNDVLPQGTVTFTILDFLLTDFVVENALLNLNDIDEINLNFTTAQGNTDWTLQRIHITMVPVGGSMMPAEMTALLLAGAELNAIWILPAIAAIGIGAFVVTRKRK